MCDLFSWIEDKNGNVWFNTDEDIEIAKMSFVDGIGHRAIEQIWKVSGENKESLTKVPLKLADAVNRGKCIKMAAAGRAKGVHYNSKGEIDAPWWPAALIEEARTLKYFDNHAESLPEWKLFDTRRDAWEATGNLAWDSVAWFIVAQDAVWKASREAAWYVAQDAVGAAVGAAVELAVGAAVAAVWDVARNATLLARCQVAFYNKPRSKHFRQAKKRWEVWQRGYGCFCEVGGVLYCYKRP